jgi:hypothetical protein
MMFKRDLSVHKSEFQRNGYILLKDVISDEFMAYLKDFHRRSLDGTVAEHGKWRIGGKKQQFVFDFGSDAVIEEFRAGIAVLTGMRPEKIAISERHLKQYEEDAPDYPAPHKDRGASKISVGLPVHLGPGTSVCVMPGLDRTPNPGERAIYMTEQDNPDLANIYQSKDALLLNEQLGDMIVFLGSTIFHERVRPRGTAVLYIKINDENLDPLGEDIYSSVKQQVPGALPVSA